MSATTHRTPGETFAGYTELEATTCGHCGIMYAAPRRMMDEGRRLGEWKITVHCPNGHPEGWGDDPTAKAQRERDRARDEAAAQRAYRQQAEASARAQRAAATRARNERNKDRRRVANGVCPCCGRTFKQLARHMKSKHPDFVEEAKA